MSRAGTHLARVSSYFVATRPEYERFWTGARDLGLHLGYYDARTTSHSAALVRMNEVLARYAEISVDDRVLDAGCGYGGSAVWLARLVGCDVVGVNLVPFQTRRARRMADRLNARGHVAFVLADYSETPFADASFDVIWALESVVHAEAQEFFVREAERLLRPGGRLLIAEYTARDYPPLTCAERRLIASGLQGWAMTRLLTARQYTELALSHGFTAAATYDLTEAIRPSISHLGKLRLPTTWVRVLFPLLNLLARWQPSNVTRASNITGGYDFARAYLLGAWRYTAIVALK